MIPRKEILAMVVAGGASRRFGRDKRLLELDGQTLLERALVAAGRLARRVIVLGDPPSQPYRVMREHPDLVWRSDAEPGNGPLCAVADAIDLVEEPWLALVAVDYPYAAQALSVLLAATKYENDGRVKGWVPVSNGRLHYLCALYSTDVWRDAPAAVAAGERSLKGYLAPVIESGAVRTVSLAGAAEMVINVNTPEDWLRIEQQRANAM